MNTYPIPLRKFLPTLERTEPTNRDSTASQLYKECPRKYFYRIVLGFREKSTEPYFSFGTAYHKFREVLEKLTKAGEGADIAFTKASEAGLKLHHTNPPETSKWKYMTQGRLLDSFLVAYDWWKLEKKSKRKFVLESEMDFATLDEESGMIISGKIDQVITDNGRVWIRDFKTSSKIGPYYERGLEPNDQATRYTWGASKLTGKVVAGTYFEVLYQTQKDKPKIVTYISSRNPYQMETWLREQRFWNKQLASSRNNDEWPMNEKACTFCKYHIVCKSFNDAGIERNLKENFTHEPWDHMNRVTDNDS